MSEDAKAWWSLGAQGRSRPPDSRFAGRIRYLLARRLAREGRWREAIPYYPGRELPRDADAVASWLECAGDPSCPDERRTEALWQTAQRLRWRGMELLGAELDPDHYVWGGSFGGPGLLRSAPDGEPLGDSLQ